jgi:hypothetical protein
MGILIISKRDGFRRAGIEHPSTPTLHDDDRFTKEQLAALEAEPMLIVQYVEDEPEGVKPDEPVQEDKKDAKPKGKQAAAADKNGAAGGEA